MQLQPCSQQELVEIVHDAGEADAPLALSGHGTKQNWGRPVVAQRHLSMRGFSGIVDYVAAELVLTAGAGTPLAEIKAALATEHQHLAFEPPDLGPIFGAAADRATIGGVLAANLSGPRRPFAGAARDFFLGFSGVNGRGEVIKAGGKVVKNVTGYDLPKLIAGSFGTLVALTEITIKVMPAPETACSVIVFGLAVAPAHSLMIAALGSAADPSGAVFLPADMIHRIDIEGVPATDKSALVFRLEGAGCSIAYRRQILQSLLCQTSVVLDAAASERFWQLIRDLHHFQDDPTRALWLLSVPPASGARVIQCLNAAFPDLRYSLDWGGGRIFLSLPVTAPDAGAMLIRNSLNDGGHASLLRAPVKCRQGDHVFTPEVPLAVLQRVRAAFDPLRIFNRGRLHPEI